VCLCL